MNNKEEQLNCLSLPTCTRSNRMELYRDAIRNVRQMSIELVGSLPAETTIIFDQSVDHEYEARILIVKSSKLKRNMRIAIQHVFCNT